MTERYSELIENLEFERVRTLVRILAAGELPPEPRAPLASGVSGLSAQPLEQLLVRAGEDDGKRRSLTGGT